MLLFIVVIISLNYSYTKDITIPTGASGKHINVDGVKLRVQQIGEGPDLLFLHGSIGSLEDFETVVPLLKGYRITSFDRIGHGYSAMPPVKANIENNARYASALIKTLKLKDVTVIGHSYGGSIALKMAINNDPNIKSLVLIAPAAYSLTPARKIEFLLARPVIGLGMIRILHGSIAENMLRNGLLTSLQPNLNVMPSGFVDARIQMWNNPGVLFTRTQQTDDVTDELNVMQKHYKNIKLPISILLGEKEAHTDIAQGCKLLAEQLTNGNLIEVPEAGHYLQYKDPLQVSKVIKQQTDRRP